jgi:outer membrane receptor protein involved in Fe transport
MPAAIICALVLFTPVSAAALKGPDAALELPRYIEPQTDTRVTGIVRDTTGAPVPNASILLRAGTQIEGRTLSGPDGRFVIASAPAGALTVVVRAGGFAETTRAIAEAGPRQDLEIVVSPATLTESVTVTATRNEQRTGDVPASVTVLDRQEISESPAMVADDVLRQVPTFSLFRRTSSLASHPTAQGVSLRGIGPSGVSRTLVLLDGVPVNDPFGGWVYWSRVPLERVDRVELVDGSTSSLYGNYAMGGVISIVTGAPAAKTAEVGTQFGNRNTKKLDLFASHVWHKLGASIDGNLFDTDGYPIVSAAERGRVDTRAGVTFGNVNVKLDYDLANRGRAFLRAGYFHENRDNGKVSTIDGTEEANDTTWKSVNGGVRLRLPDQSDLQATVFTDIEKFHSNFLAVPAANPPRSIGRMTLNQTVPTNSVGSSVQWSRAFGSRQFFTAGTDWRWVDGDSREDALDPVTGSQVTLNRISGGTQQSLGVFAQDLIAPLPQLTVTLSVRGDHWRSYDAHNLEHSVPSGAPTANNDPSLPSRSDSVASPRAAVLYHVNPRVSVWGDIGQGFRAPTLNELYRQFRVGTTLTLANNTLGPERLVGGNIGTTILPTSNTTLRVTWFDNRIKDPVSNVTISRSGASVTQQRQNLGRTHVWGVQTDFEYRLGSFWRVTAGYLFDQAKVSDNPADPTLEGLFLPQVPEHRGSLRVAYANPRYATIAVGTQFVGAQYDDDRNSPDRQLGGYALVDVTATHTIHRTLELFFGVQNLFNREYAVGTLPTTIGSPRLVTGGIRVRVGGTR